MSPGEFVAAPHTPLQRDKSDLGSETDNVGRRIMRNWCAAVAMSTLLALPVCAQQARKNGDDTSAAGATAEKSPARTNGAEITPASRNLFALPESPRPKPFPAGAESSSDT